MIVPWGTCAVCGVGLFLLSLQENYTAYGFCEPAQRHNTGKGSITLLSWPVRYCCPPWSAAGSSRPSVSLRTAATNVA